MNLVCFGVLTQGALRYFGDAKAWVLPAEGNSHETEHPALFVNGIQNDLSGTIDRARSISQLLQVPVIPVWNPTFGASVPGFFGDMAQVLLVNKPGLPDASVRAVSEEIRRQLSRRPHTDRLTVVAHSQGAAILSTAVGFLTLDERERLRVITFGEASWTFPGGIGELERNVSIFDVVPLTAGSAWLMGTQSRQALAVSPLGHSLELYLDAYAWKNSPENLRLRRERRQREIERNLGRR